MSGGSEDDHYLLIIMQYLRERQHLDSLHTLQRECGLYFDLAYVESLVQQGLFNETRDYLKGFISYGDTLSMNIFYEITKQKFLEAVYMKQYLLAVDICRDEMSVFKDSHKDAVPSLMLLMTDEAFRDFRNSQEAQGARRVPDIVQVNAREEESPLKNFDIESSRAKLCSMLKQSVDVHPNIRGKCFLHPLESSRLKVLCNQSREWQHSQCRTKLHDHYNTCGPTGILHDHNCERFLSVASPKNISHLPKKPLLYLDVSSGANCFEFNPKNELLLAIGALDGSLFLRNLGNLSGDRTINFSIWNPLRYSRDFLATSNQCSVTCIRWSPCGSFIALGFSKKLVQVYSFEDGADLRSLVEIEAHSGSVNDISILAERSIIITCGQDCLIKTWSLSNGENCGVLSGHLSNVVCLSVSLKGPKLLIYSVDACGEVRAWELVSGGKSFEVTRINYDECVIHYIVSNLDGSMILSSGLDQEDYPCLTEWSYGNESTSLFCKRKYLGLRKKLQGEVNFDFKNGLLVASSDNSVHFWNKDDSICLLSTTANAVLGDAPPVRLSNDGSFLAVLDGKRRVRILSGLKGLDLYIAESAASSRELYVNPLKRRFQDAQTKNAGHTALGDPRKLTSSIPSRPHIGQTSHTLASAAQGSQYILQTSSLAARSSAGTVSNTNLPSVLDNKRSDECAGTSGQ